STQRTASMMLDLPQPLGPTTPTSWPGSRKLVGSANDLKPESLIELSRTMHQENHGPAPLGGEALAPALPRLAQAAHVTRHTAVQRHNGPPPCPGQRAATAMLAALLLFVHLISIVVWVGGMAFAHFCLRPALPLLPPPER